MEFGKNQIVKLRNGLVGVVTSFNGKPSHLIFKAYTNPITQYNDNLEKKNHDYDVVEIYDGTKLDVITDVWKRGALDNFEMIWKREE